MNLDLIQMEFPEDCNVIVGQSHFIKTVEDIYETIVTGVPGMKFGLAFNEASGPCLVRKEGNDDELMEIAVKNALAVGAGHLFILVIKNGYPINILNALKNIQEVCRIFAATANPLQVIIAETDQGRAVLGVVDGFVPKGVEKKEDIAKRKEFLREITGYKR
ncbi:MAG TPA: adenosine-specific kinase [Bacteroidales bacterium]|nr:adenosine-specific kinase [Bacteroidales bacterium]